MACLYRSYLDWATIANPAATVTPEGFDALILDSGHSITLVEGERFAVGMTFRSDVEAAVRG